jgi:Uma2 family endonuclease
MTVSGKPISLTGDYLKSDGQPVAETEVHRDNLLDTIASLRRHFAADPQMYVSGNMFVHYVPGDRRRHVSPDVFAVRGVRKGFHRDYYLVWEEGQPPHVVIEFTSRTTRGEDVDDKYEIYRDWMKVREYFLFDPRQEYLEPSLQGHRLEGGQYVPIEPVDGRLPSEILGLHLLRDGWRLRFLDPTTGTVVPLPDERADAAEANARQVEERATRAEADRDRMQAEIERLRQQLDALRGQSPPGNGP